ncbi:hypothetical protein [Pseudomonas glycinae]|uniref:hypothetical protein n=1 Tax=Pseudomonas glycinae TaxID=1785145 RepID=UPI001F1BB46E|nr:hypothetical protein [Pseudomonas glycinae]
MSRRFQSWLSAVSKYVLIKRELTPRGRISEGQHCVKTGEPRERNQRLEAFRLLPLSDISAQGRRKFVLKDLRGWMQHLCGDFSHEV